MPLVFLEAHADISGAQSSITREMISASPALSEQRPDKSVMCEAYHTNALTALNYV